MLHFNGGRFSGMEKNNTNYVWITFNDECITLAFMRLMLSCELFKTEYFMFVKLVK